MATQILTQARLQELLTYDLNTGVFTNLMPRPKVRVGTVAGHTHAGHGYRQIKLDGKLYLAHRLAWLHTYGVWPTDQIDHINRCRTDNRLANLREVTNAQNCQNRPLQCNATSGYAGVTWNKIILKWHARISLGGKRIHLGWFLDKDSAVSARATAELLYHTHRQA